jgi:hypothetical protein
MPRTYNSTKFAQEENAVIAAVMQAINTGAAVLHVTEVAEYLFTSCRHKTLGLPIQDRVSSCSYQVCLECGKKRLFDEKKFLAYGGFGNDLAGLLARSATKRNPALSNESSLPVQTTGSLVDDAPCGAAAT